jgi:hypothetical protein
MHREKGYDTLGCNAFEFHDRHRMTQLLVRACLGRPWLSRGTVALLRRVAMVAAWLGSCRLPQFACSGIFSLLYWQGVCDEMGGAAPVWRFVAASRGNE